MIHFVVATGPPGSCASIGSTLSRAVAATTNLGGEAVTATSPTGTWALAAVVAPDGVLSPRWHTEGEGLVVSNGTVTGRDERVSLAAVLARFRAGGLEAATRSLAGTYNLVCTSPEQGLTISGDLAAFYPLYHGGDGGDRVVVSNRSTTVAHVLGVSGWNPEPLGWMISTGHICGEDVPARGVRSLRAGHVGRVPWGGSVLTVEDPARPALPPAEPGGGRPRLEPAEWDAIVDDLVGQVQGLAALETPLYLQLTGGKDSRLLLSLFVAAGLTDVETYTSGPPDSEEVRCAAAVAAAAGVAHRCGSPPEAWHPVTRQTVGGNGSMAPRDERWQELAQAIGRFDGIIPTWGALRTPSSPASLMVKGWAGEVYRFKSRLIELDDMLDRLPVRSGSDADVEALTRGLLARMDPLRILTPSERTRQVDWLRDWVQRTVESTRADLIPDLFYIDHRLGQLAGPMTQDIPVRIVANPLVSHVATSTYAQLSLRARSVDRLHYEVMRRAAPQLVSLPFVYQAWAPAILADAPDDVATEPFEAALQPTRTVPLVRRWPRWSGHLPIGHSALAERARVSKRELTDRARTGVLAGTRWSRPRPGGHEESWALVEEDPAGVTALFQDAADAGLSSICNVGRLCRLVSQPGAFIKREELQISTAVGAAMVLLGRTERVVETPQPE